MNEVTLAVSRVHNSSVALFVGEELIFHIENERFSNIKYDWFPYHAILKIKEYVDHIDNLVLAGVSKTSPVESFSELDVYSSLILGLGKSFRDHGFKRHDIWHEHHKLHAACAFYNSGFESALCIIKDGMGSDFPLEGDVFKNGTVGREIGTAFLAKFPGEFEVIDKHIAVNFDLPYEPFYIDRITYLSNTFSEGLAFQKTSKSFGFHELDAGKVMGMASHGKSAGYNIYQNGLISKDLFFYENRDLRKGCLSIKNLNDFKSQADFSYDLQHQIQEKVLKDILELIDKTGERNICLSGGFFLNCMANYHILKNLPPGINIYVEPISSDAGTAIGAAKLIIKPRSLSKQSNIYFGPQQSLDISSIKSKYTDCNFSKASSTEVANLLSDKKVVAIFQGRSESGPRALGNRSILYDPRDPVGKDRVNQIKKREWFRPFAGTVLFEEKDSWFNLKGLSESPFMMYAVDILEDKKSLIPAVSHVDGTCRVQSLTKEHNKNFYELIDEFYKITGVPILLNTSFNLAGNCIVETIDQAIETLKKSSIDYLYLPEYKLLIS